MIKKIATLFKSIFIKLNLLSEKFQHLIQTVGIVVGLYLIYLTYFSVKISNEQLKISQRQEYQKQLPIWQFDIIDSEAVARLRPFSQEVKLEQATGYFPSKLFFKKSTVWEIDPPNFDLHLTLFKLYMGNLIKENFAYTDSMISLAMRNSFPVGIEFSYVQFGESKSVKAIFAIQYGWIRVSQEDVKIELKGVQFMRYLSQKEILMEELNKIIDENYKEVKIPKE